MVWRNDFLSDNKQVGERESLCVGGDMYIVLKMAVFPRALVFSGRSDLTTSCDRASRLPSLKILYVLYLFLFPLKKWSSSSSSSDFEVHE